MTDERYDIIAADPPWSFESTKGGGNRRDVQRQYKTMSVKEIVQLGAFVNTQAKPISRLFLWVVDSQLEAGLSVMRSWGYKPTKIAFMWAKLSKAGLKGSALARALAEDGVIVYSGEHGYRRTVFGAGRTTRNGAEYCLLGVRGSMAVDNKSQRQVIHAPVREHSRKPDEFFERVEKMYPDTQRLEMFARRRRRGWDGWGDEL